MQKKITFIVPYPFDEAPSQRFRFEQYHDILKRNGFHCKMQSFVDIETWRILYLEGNTFRKAIGIVKGFLRRIKIVFQLRDSDFVFIHRETSPIGPPIFEFIIAKLLRKKIIYDFDDAIWIKNTSGSNKVIAFLKWHSKVKWICKWSHKVSCGNAYLEKYAQSFNKSTTIIPTSIDTVGLHNQSIEIIDKKTIIGWTGTHSTMKYIDFLLPILDQLALEHTFSFLIISNQKPNFEREYVQFIEWQKDHEIEDLLKFDIGVMPLENDLWSEGKCGFKALQYLALGIPTIVSPVGVNLQIIQDQENGLLAETQEQWKTQLSCLLVDLKLRKKLAENGTQTIEKHFSNNAITPIFLELFE
jgi:glycosyltransferase involved in cell wall biosynthesis